MVGSCEHARGCIKFGKTLTYTTELQIGIRHVQNIDQQVRRN